MLNWEMLTPRNIFAIAAMGILGYIVFNYFFKKVEGK